jgi:hypothetical protein
MKLLSIPMLLLTCSACGIVGGLFGGKEDVESILPSLGPPFDCTHLPTQDDWDFIELEYTSEEFAFDKSGYVIIASDWSGAILRENLTGDVEVIAPFQSEELAGVDLFPNGDILFADEENGTLMKMTLSGEESVVAGALLSPNSVIVHPDGMVFTTAFDAILEVIPGSGEVSTLVEPGGYDLDGLTLSRDFQYLWFNEDELGTVYRVRVDGTGDATLMAEVDLAQGVELDGMTTDICGNVYALHTDGHVTRIRPDGRTEEFVKLAPIGDDMWTSAAHFGSGMGGWRADALYIMDRFGGLFEVEVGVPGVPEPHL